MSDDRKFEKTLPISWAGWDEAGPFAIQFYDVEFLEDFGSFKTGEKAGCLYVCPLYGYLVSYDEEGNEVKKIDIKFVPR